MPCRPKTVRRKEDHKKGSGQRLVKRGREMTCQYYFQKGHNKATCAVREEVEQATKASVEV